MIELISFEYVEKIKKYVIVLIGSDGTKSIIQRDSIEKIKTYMIENKIIYKENNEMIFNPDLVLEYIKLKSL